jgi:hypothetical protein
MQVVKLDYGKALDKAEGSVVSERKVSLANVEGRGRVI